MPYGVTYELPPELSVSYECKRHFSDVPFANQVAMSLNTISQKLNESLHICISRYSQLQYVTMDKTTYKNIDPRQIYHTVASINNTMTTDKNAYLCTCL